MERPLISFVLPAYKAKYFKEAVDGILSQTYTNFELIIVNDCSPENIDEIVAQYNDKRIRYYKNEKNIGGTDLVAQWNHCITFAKGEYLVLASDDDVYYPNYLEELVPLTQKYPNINVFRPRVEHIDGNNNITGVEGYLPEFVSQLEFAYHLYNGNIYHGIPYYLLRTNALNNIGGFLTFPMAWYSDDATIISLASSGIVSAQKIVSKFRIDAGISLSSNNSKRIIEKKIKAAIQFTQWINKFNFTRCQDYDSLYKQFIYNMLNKGQELGYLSLLPIWTQIKYMKKCTFLSKKNKLKLILKNSFYYLAHLLHII